VTLFEIPAPPVSDGTLLFRAKLRTDKPEPIGAHLNLEFRPRGDPDLRINSNGLTDSIPANGWGSFEARLTIDPKRPPDRILLNLSFGVSKFWIKDVELLHAPAQLPPTVDPFVILAKDKRAETLHPTLADAAKAAQSGDTIEIRGDGPRDDQQSIACLDEDRGVDPLWSLWLGVQLLE
jgi:hypothetical protein